jgi:predicted aspartyl protease
MNRRRRHALLVLLSALTIASLSTSVSAQSAIYRWVDASGEVHFTQGLDSVPQSYRPRAVLIGHDRPSEPTSLPSLNPLRRSGQVSFTPGQPIMVTARINDGGSANLMLDTGAARTVINPAVLSALGVSYKNVVRAALKGVTGGPELVDAVTLDSIEVDGARHGPLLVISHDTGFGPLRGDGLLGRDYLDNFTITIDNTAGLLTLTPKDPR